MKRAYAKGRGFTIVELLIVIVVVAILAAISIIAYNGIASRAAEASVQSDLRSAQVALEREYARNGSFPASLPPNIATSHGNTFSYTSTSHAYCLTATSSDASAGTFSISNSSGLTKGACPGHAGGGGVAIIDGTAIQDITQAQCQALPVFTGNNGDAVRTVADSRGGATRTYEIAKLADGKCWMLTNLKLGSTTGSIVLTQSDSNIVGNFTLPQVDHTTTSYAAVYGPVPGDTGSGATNYGYLYNTGSVTADGAGDVCPAGWRLPTGGSGGDFAVLGAAFGDGVSSWLYEGAFRGVFAGDRISHYSYSGYAAAGEWGRYWSSTVWNEGPSYRYSLAFHSEAVDTSSSDDYRYHGRAVRCILN